MSRTGISRAALVALGSVAFFFLLFFGVGVQLGDVAFSEGDCAETSQIGDAAALKAATQLLVIAEGTLEKALLLQTLVTGRSAEVITKPRSVDKCEVTTSTPHPPLLQIHRDRKSVVYLQ